MRFTASPIYSGTTIFTRVGLKKRSTNNAVTSKRSNLDFFDFRLNILGAIVDHIDMGKTLSRYGMPPLGGSVLCGVINKKTLV